MNDQMEEVMKLFSPPAEEMPSDSPAKVEPTAPSVEESPMPAEGSAPSEPESEKPESLDPTTLEALGLDEGGESPSPEGDTSSSEVDLELLSKTLGFDQDQLSVRDGKVFVRTKVDGEAFDKPFSDVVKGYQLEAHTTRKSQALEEERRQWSEKRQQEEQQYQQRAEYIQKLLDRDMESINERYSKVDWNKIRAEEPAQYAALVADYQREMGQVQGQRQQIDQEVQRLTAEKQQEYARKMTEIKQRELQALSEAMKWSPDRLAEESKPVQQYLAGKAGYTPDEIGQVYDHRFVVLADKARQWDELQVKVKTLRQKQVPNKPKVPAGSSGASRSQTESRKVSSLVDRAKQSGRLNDQTDAAVALLFKR